MMNISQNPICNICKSKRTRYVFLAIGETNKEFKIFECLTCGISFTFPMPSREEMEPYYSHGYYGEDVRRLYYARELVAHLMQIGRGRLIGVYKKRGRIIDIGCGDGSFLKAMAGYGWEAYGLEISKSASDLIRDVKGIKYVNGELDSTKFPSNYFDVVTLWHVLEHFYDPVTKLREISRILKKDGLLFLSVPNFDSFQARFGKNRWFHLDPPRHLWHFSSRSLSFIMNKGGFIIKRRNFLSYYYDLFGWWQTLLNRSNIPFNHLYHFLKREKAYKRVTVSNRFYSQIVIAVSVAFLPLLFLLTLIECFLNKGGTITVLAKKKHNEGCINSSP